MDQKMDHLKNSIETQSKWVNEFHKLIMIKNKELKKFSTSLDKINLEEFDMTMI